LAVDFYWKDFCPSVLDRGFNPGTGIRFDQQDHATAAAGTANLSSERALPPGVFNYAVDEFRGYGGQISLAKKPLFTHQPAGLVPFGGFQRHAQQLRDLGDFLHTVTDGALAIDVRLENFPIVNAMLAGLAGVTNHDAAFQFVEIEA
jgi:hypothetical protein